MRQIELGRTGLKVPVIGQGTYRYAAGVEPLRRGIELGATFLDTAELYENEEIVGRAVAGMRERVFIATKVWRTNLRRSDLLRAAEASLQRLNVDHIDLYQVHRPRADVPIAETMGAMEELVDSGRVRFIGVSNFSRSQLEEAQAAMRSHPIVSNQVRYNLIDRRIERDLVPYCAASGVTLIAYSPLAEGIEHIRGRDREGALDGLGAQLNRTPAQVALGWCVSHPNVLAIPKASSVAHVEENCAAGDLDTEEMRLLEGSIRPIRHRTRLEKMAGRVLRPLLGGVE